MQNCLSIGVDVALKGNHFCVMNFDQHIYFNLKFPNNPEGNDMVINKIKDIENKFFFEKIIIVIESTGMYSFNPTCYLSSFAIYFLYENIIFYIVYKKRIKYITYLVYSS